METPTINVNIAVCHCGPDPHCTHHNKPLHLPCPIPRSVTFQVALGKCTCGYVEDAVSAKRAHADHEGVLGNFRACHAPSCPARPVKATVDVSGNEWVEIKVLNVERHDGRHLTNELVSTCADRLALIKALVLGRQAEPAETEPVLSLLSQRDAVYAALADMARAEEASLAARDSLHVARGLPLPRRLDPAMRESAIELAAYIESLIGQVGVLP